MRLSMFFNKNTVDKHNRPPHLHQAELPGNGLSPSIKAVQMWALLKFLLIVISNAIPHSEPHWLFLLHFSELVDLIFALRFTVGMVAYL